MKEIIDDMNDIEQMTADCPRTDCSLSSRGHVATCMGWTPTFDKQGNRTDQGDPNIHSSTYRCSVCSREWLYSRQYDKTEITEKVSPSIETKNNDYF